MGAREDPLGADAAVADDGSELGRAGAEGAAAGAAGAVAAGLDGRRVAAGSDAVGAEVGDVAVVEATDRAGVSPSEVRGPAPSGGDAVDAAGPDPEATGTGEPAGSSRVIWGPSTVSV